MKVVISIINDRKPDITVVYQVDDTQAKGLPIMPVILSVMKFMENQIRLCDRFIYRKHPLLKQYDGKKQDELLRIVHNTATIADLNPKPDTDSKLKIVKGN